MSENPHSLKNKIAVISMHCRFPRAGNTDEYWHNLKHGIESLDTLSDEELLAAGVSKSTFEQKNYVRKCATPQAIDLFDASFFNYHPNEAAILDPQQRMFLECAWETVEKAGYNTNTYPGLIGIFAGSGLNRYLLNNVLPGVDLQQSARAFDIFISSDKDFLPTRVAYKLNLKGPAINVQTACSTSLVAIHMACRSLLQGECDMALAGGVSLKALQKEGYLYQEGMILSPDGHCRAFDKDAGGIFDGSGVGIVMLKPLEDALEDGDQVMAVIRGSAVNNDGAQKVGFTAPSVDGQAEVISEALDFSGVDPATISYVEAHGTGTILGDPIEIRALKTAFEDRAEGELHCAIGSAKTNIGHLDTAAGVAGFIKTVLALQHKQIPPSLNFTSPNPAIDFGKGLYVNTELKDWEQGESPRRAAMSSFGIGGTNAHLILEEAPSTVPPKASSKPQVLILSAKSSSALEQATDNLASFLKENPHINLSDVAYTLQTGRQTFSHKRAVLCKDVEDAITCLESRDGKRVKNGVSDLDSKQPVFLFSGQGSQYVNMGRGLYETEPVFQQTVDYCADFLAPTLGFDLRTILFPDAEENEAAMTAKLKQTAVAQPAIFTISFALSKLWIDRGVTPTALLGHSVGEYVAACLAGVFSLDQALGLIALRGKLMQSMSPGKMLAIPLSEKEIQRYLHGDIELATINSPSSCVLSGPEEAIQKLSAALDEQGIGNIVLQTSHAFHSSMMEPMLKEFETAFTSIKPQAPQIPFLSNLTGKWITPTEATSPQYWSSHLRNAVRFSDNLEQLFTNEQYLLLEVGPGKTLASLAKRHPKRLAAQTVSNSLPHPMEARAADDFFNEATAELWLAGVNIDWEEMYVEEKRSKVALPTYPFERKSYWIEPQEQTQQNRRSLEKNPNMTEWFYAPSWKRSSQRFLSEERAIDQQNWIVFTDESEVCLELCSQIESAGGSLLKVRAGVDFDVFGEKIITIRPGHEEDYKRIFDHIKTSEFPTHILHAWNEVEHQDSVLNNVDQKLNQSLHSLLALAKAIEPAEGQQQTHLSLLTHQVHEVIGVEELNPVDASMVGALKVIDVEYDQLSCRHIDLSLEGSNSKQSAAQVLRECCSESQDLQVAFRGTYRWLPDFEKIQTAKPPQQDTLLRKEGVYLITGGFGGMGYTLATDLAKRYQARLILLGRSNIPPKDAWDSFIREHGQDDPTSKRIAQVSALEALGSQVLAFGVDVSDQVAMEAIIKESKAAFGKIDGVLHFAGLADYAGLIRLRSKADTDEVLSPKLKGSLVLTSLLQADPPDFMMMASTIGSVLHHAKFGQVAYSAANEFLDAYAYALNREGRTRALTINWNDWKEVGMTVEALKKWSERSAGQGSWNLAGDQGASLLADFLTPAEGTAVLYRALHSDHPRLIISTRDLEAAREEDRREYLAAMNQEADTGSIPAHARPELATTFVAPESDTEKAIALIWQRQLGLEEVGVDDNFMEVGGHSLIGIQVLSEIRSTMGVEVPIHQLFETPTIKGLAEYIDNAIWSQKQKKELASSATIFEEQGEI